MPPSPPSPGPFLPPLSERQTELLAAFIDSRGDLASLLKSHKIPPTELLEWSQSPAVQPHLAALQSLSNIALNYRASQSRTLALITLENILTSSSDPIEQRRISSAIAAVAPSSRATDRERPSRSTDPGSARSAPSAARPRSASPPPPISPDTDLDPAAPRPAFIPHDRLAAAIAESLRTPADPAILEPLHTLLAPAATLAGQPASSDLDTFTGQAADAFSDVPPISGALAQPLDQSQGGATIRYHIALAHGDSDTTLLLLTLTRQPPDSPRHPSCWLIAALDFDSS